MSRLTRRHVALSVVALAIGLALFTRHRLDVEYEQSRADRVARMLSETNTVRLRAYFDAGPALYIELNNDFELETRRSERPVKLAMSLGPEDERYRVVLDEMLDAKIYRPVPMSKLPFMQSDYNPQEERAYWTVVGQCSTAGVVSELYLLANLEAILVHGDEIVCRGRLDSPRHGRIQQYLRSRQNGDSRRNGRRIGDTH